jgi:hypothetical protein
MSVFEKLDHLYNLEAGLVKKLARLRSEKEDRKLANETGTDSTIISGKATQVTEKVRSSSIDDE